MSFQNKIALVTGSGRGIGKAIALKFAEEGADLVINYFRNRLPAEETAALVKALGRRTLVVKANVGTPEGIEHLFHETEAEFGHVDILINNAASGYNKPIVDQKIKGWDWTMNINARAAFFCAQRAAASMIKRGGGHIISLSSPGSGRVLPDYSLVGASKAALEAITRYLAVELGPQKIIVNAVAPGLVATSALTHFVAARTDGLLDRIAQNTPARRLVTPEDVAGVVAFLCSPAADMIRGQTITIDGGMSLPLRDPLADSIYTP